MTILASLISDSFSQSPSSGSNQRYIQFNILFPIEVDQVSKENPKAGKEGIFLSLHSSPVPGFKNHIDVLLEEVHSHQD